MDDLDELIESADYQTDDVTVCFRGKLVTRHAQLVAELRDAANRDRSLAESPESLRLAAEVVDVEQQIEAASKTFTLTGIGSKKWANLLAKHPPSKEDRRNGQDHNPDTFPPAAFAACSVSPDVSPLQAQKIFEKLIAGEWNKIWVTLIALNVVGLSSPKLAAATELLRANEQSSTTPDLEGSLGAPSSAGGDAQSAPTTTATEDDSIES